MLSVLKQTETRTAAHEVSHKWLRNILFYRGKQQKTLLALHNPLVDDPPVIRLMAKTRENSRSEKKIQSRRMREESMESQRSHVNTQATKDYERARCFIKISTFWKSSCILPSTQDLSHSTYALHKTYNRPMVFGKCCYSPRVCEHINILCGYIYKKVKQICSNTLV